MRALLPALLLVAITGATLVLLGTDVGEGAGEAVDVGEIDLGESPRGHRLEGPEQPPPSDPGRESAARSIVAGSRVLDPDYVVVGRLVEREGGGPVAGAAVGLDPRPSVGAEARRVDTKTRSDGSFTLRWQPSIQGSELELRVVGDDLRLARLERPGEGIRLDLGELRVPQPRSVDGRVLGPDGAPLAGVEVGVRDPGFTVFAVTGEDGRFRWRSRSRVRVIGVRTGGQRFWFGVPMAKDVEEFRVPELRYDTFPVVGVDARPLGGMEIRYQVKLDGNLTVESEVGVPEDQPRIAVPVPMERHRPRFKHRWSADDAWTAEGLRRLVREGMHDVIEVQRPRRIELRVWSEEGPALTSGVEFFLFAPVETVDGHFVLGYKPVEAEALGDGWYAVDGVASNVLAVACRKEGYLRRAALLEDHLERGVAAGDRSGPIAIELHHPAPGAIAVVLEDGTPVEGLQVVLVCEGDLSGAGGQRCSSGLGTQRVLTDAEGTARFEACWHRLATRVIWQGRSHMEEWESGDPDLRIVLPTP